MSDDSSSRTRGTLRVARSRGVVSGVLLIALGVWGALIPFIGPYFKYAFTPDSSWTWTSGRFWLEILPGVVAIVGGLILLTTANRITAVIGGYLASAAGVWFIIGPVLGQLLSSNKLSPGQPTGGKTLRVFEQLGFFSLLGAVILFLAAQALGRFTVKSVRDVRAAEKKADKKADNKHGHEDHDHEGHDHENRSDGKHDRKRNDEYSGGPAYPDADATSTRNSGSRETGARRV